MAAGTFRYLTMVAIHLGELRPRAARQ